LFTKLLQLFVYIYKYACMPLLESTNIAMGSFTTLSFKYVFYVHNT